VEISLRTQDQYRRGPHQPYVQFTKAPNVLLRHTEPLSQTWFTRAGVYAGQVLKGAKPADMPIVRPYDKFNETVAIQLLLERLGTITLPPFRGRICNAPWPLGRRPESPS
jgi:hypothetical protein